MNDKSESSDPALRALLRAARAEPPLPPGFQEAVWRRLERAATARSAGSPGGWLDRVATWLLQPRLALTGVAVMLLAGSAIGVRQGINLADELAKQRYLAAVSPFATR